MSGKKNIFRLVIFSLISIAILVGIYQCALGEESMPPLKTQELSSQQMIAGSKYTWNNIDLNAGEYDKITVDLNWRWVWAKCSGASEYAHDTSVYINDKKVTGNDRIISFNSPSCGSLGFEIEYGSDSPGDPNPGEGYEALYGPTKDHLVLDITDLVPLSGKFSITVEHKGSKYTLESAPIIKAYRSSNVSLLKTSLPQSIKQGQTTTITLTVKNTGITDIYDIEVADIIQPDLIILEGDTSKTYKYLKPKDSREFHYVIQLDEPGTYNFDPALVMYANEKGNYYSTKSNIATIKVNPSIITDSTKTVSNKPRSNTQSASVNLHGEKTDVALGEDVLLKLSAVNIIGNPTMHVQVIIIPPSGWSVTSSEFAKSGAGQYTTTYELESGGGKDIEVRIVPNQIGDDFQVEGRIIYYFGDDLATREDHTLSLPIKVRAESDDGGKSSADSEESKTPGFGVLVAVIGLLVTACLVRRK